MSGGSHLLYRAPLDHWEESVMAAAEQANTTTPRSVWGQPVGKETEAFERIWQFRVAVYGVAGSAVCVFGILGNLVSIVVLSRFPRTSSSPVLLICLEMFDTLILLSELFLETLPVLGKAGMISPGYNVQLKPVYAVLYPVSHVSQIGTTYMTVLVTCERFVAVVKPLLVSRLCSRRAARWAVAAVLLGALLFNIPLYLAYTSGHRWDPEKNITAFFFERSEFGKGQFYNDYYVVWIHFGFSFLLPFLVVVLLNCLVIRALRRSTAFQPNAAVASSTRAHRKYESRLTAMMFAVTSVFFVTEFCQAAALIMIRKLNHFSECSVSCNNFTTAADFMVLLNSAVNVLLYCAVGQRFRKIFVATFCCKRLPSDKSSSGVSGQRPSRNAFHH